MTIISQFEDFQARYGIRAGYRAPSVIAEAIRQLPPGSRPSNGFIHMMATRNARHLAGGLNVPAIMLGRRRPQTFNRQYLRLPMVERFAPLGVHDTRANLIKGVMLQHVADYFVVVANMLGVIALLLGGRPAQALELSRKLEMEALVTTQTSLISLVFGPPAILAVVAFEMLQKAFGARGPGRPRPPTSGHAPLLLENAPFG